ncbi:MAG: hypothetical protein M3539_16785 [Acidobacteriota bacterium]|nr:hypothetical protein [Acidobacteriota bacterium]
MSTNKGHRLRWLALILSGLLLVVFGASFLWWQHYKTTPAYSLALVVDAAQRNDGPAFDRLVDLEKVVDNFMPQVAQTATGGLASDVAASLRTQFQSLAPDVVASIQQTIKEEIRKRINEVAGTERPFLITALAIPFKANISESDGTAKASINNGEQQVELTMERLDGGDWKVVSMRDDALAARIANNIVKNLPGSGSQLDKEMRKQLQDLPETLRKLPLLP